MNATKRSGDLFQTTGFTPFFSSLEEKNYTMKNIPASPLIIVSGPHKFIGWGSFPLFQVITSHGIGFLYEDDID